MNTNKSFLLSRYKSEEIEVMKSVMELYELSGKIHEELGKIPAPEGERDIVKIKDFLTNISIDCAELDGRCKQLWRFLR